MVSKELSKATGISPSRIASFEAGSNIAYSRTRADLRRAFERVGVSFTEPLHHSVPKEPGSVSGQSGRRELFDPPPR